ncbi:TPA: molecular chaperone [Serratia fonticola]|nr:molecular chaperone [Serratia fonticola]
MFKNYILILICFFCCQQSYAGGVSLGATRLVYPMSQDQVTLKIYNSDEKGNYLVQSWISDENNKKNKDFIITPPLFVLKSGSDNLLKVVFTGDKNSLPKDREMMFFLNAKVIPSLSEQERKIDNALLISTTTKIKLFIRPDSLKEDSFDSYKKLKCSYEDGKIKVSNASPFYMNLVSLSINGREISSAETISPMSHIYLNDKSKGNSLTFNFINDYGVQIKDRQCNL